jgi:hypothetical protein
VDIAPSPTLARRDRARDRMPRVAEVSGRMTPGRGVAATDMAADLAFPQRHPVRPLNEAFLARHRRL